MSAGAHSATDHPRVIILFAEAHLQDAKWVLEDQSFQYRSALVVGLIGRARGERGVDQMDGTPSVVPCIGGDVYGYENIFGQLASEWYCLVAVVGVIPRFHGGNLDELFMSGAVCGANQVLVVEYQHIPDDNSVFDGAVLLVKQTTVEDGQIALDMSKMVADVSEFLDEMVG